MAINLPIDAALAAPVEQVAQTRPAARVAPSPAHQKQTEPAAQSSVVPNPEETNVAFRRDVNGQIYYVFTDSQSGRELQEIPPKQVRAVGQGIADFVKELQQKNSNHIEVKG